MNKISALCAFLFECKVKKSKSMLCGWGLETAKAVILHWLVDYSRYLPSEHF